MKNIAKCLLCHTIIESMHDYDLQRCDCGEIAVDGGMKMLALAKNFDNFLRVREDGTTFKPKIVENDTHENTLHTSFSEITHNFEKLVSSLQLMLENVQRLPHNAMEQPLNQYDLQTLLQVLIEGFSERRE